MLWWLNVNASILTVVKYLGGALATCGATPQFEAVAP